jgi:ABC-type multidrug transport system ATPase subunit
MSVIQVNNVSKHFGSIKAVDGLSFEVQAGQVFGFLGQNGSGKSTTIRMLLSLIHPTSGNIEIFGNSIKSNRNNVLEEIGAIIERPDLYPYLSAKEHLQLFAKLRSKKITPSSIEDTLVKVGLKDRAKDRVKTFSLGMKQRLGIGIALLHNPSLIILDEPTNGLDPQGISDIRNLIQNLAKEEGKTILVSSHILSEILHKGKKLADGPIQTLLDPNKMIVHLATTNDEQAIQVILASSFSNYLLKRPQGIYLSIPHFEIPLLNQFLVNAGVGLISVESKNSLEDYFLQLTSNSN